MPQPMNDAEQNPYICCVCHDQSGPHCDDCKELCQPTPPAPLVDGELREKCADIQTTFLEVTDDGWEMAVGNREGLYGFIAAHLQAAVRDKDNEIAKLRADIAYAIGRFQGMEMDSAYLEQRYPEWVDWADDETKRQAGI